MTPESNYPPPIDKLLTYGDCRDTMHKWPDYAEEPGLGPEHIPDLIRMATDGELNRADSDSLEVWAPIHAWRALGQLRAEAAIEPLMRLFHELEDSDWILEELPRVYGMIGPTAVPALTAYLADTSRGLYARTAAMNSLEAIAQRHSEARARCVAALTARLERFAENDPALNSFIIGDLISLRAVESVPVMERAFAANAVEKRIVGDWEDVQMDLGLLAERTSPRKSLLDGLLRTPIPAAAPPAGAPVKPDVAARQPKADRKAGAGMKPAKKLRRKKRRRKRKRK